MVKMIGIEVEEKLCDIIKKVAKIKKNSLRKYITNAVLESMRKDGVEVEKILTIDNQKYTKEIEELNNAL